MAPQRLCPTCRSGLLRLMPVLSAVSHIDYLECEACARVWNVGKGDAGVLLPLSHPLPGPTPLNRS